MNRIKRVLLFKIIVLGFIWGVISSFQKNNQLTKEEAIKLAEEFIINNGYTNLPADRKKLSYELLDIKNIDKLLARRNNTLYKKAFCTSEDEDRWHIGFLSTNVNINKLDSIKLKTNLSGRAVIVLKNGKQIKIAHKDPLFSYFEKL